MKLTELEPHWISCLGAPQDAKLGIRFNSPIDRKQRIAVFFKNPICGSDPVDLAFFQAAQMDCDHPQWEPWMSEHHAGSVLWDRSGDSFENLTLNPSIDCSKWGGWHGFVRNGEAS